MHKGMKKYRGMLTIILACAGIGLMAYYDYCDTACSYLKGDIWGVDLKWIGIGFMSVMIVLTIFRQMSFVRLLLTGGLGVEVYLYAFQIAHDVFCPFCLAFSVMVIAMFIANYEQSSVWRKNWLAAWVYFLGEVDFPVLKIRRLPLFVIGVAGFLFVWFSFSGSVTPAYGQDRDQSVPFLGSGACEVILFTDYFCDLRHQILRIGNRKIYWNSRNH